MGNGAAGDRQGNATAQASNVTIAVTRGFELARMTWIEVESLLTADTIVVIPLGAAAKEHGPHLPLNTDWLQAEYLKNKVLADADVVVAPPITYNYFPAFLEYPGSTSLSFETARDMVQEICESLGRHGPRRFYVLNYGVSTNTPLQAAANSLTGKGYLLHFTDLTKAPAGSNKITKLQQRGTHADIGETSIMLFIAPERVDMSKAVKDCNASQGAGGLTREPTATSSVYSPTGVWGDATLANAEHGAQLVAELMQAILDDIELLRNTPLPERQ